MVIEKTTQNLAILMVRWLKMSLSHTLTFVKTRGFATDIDPDLQAKLMALAVHTFKPLTDMVVSCMHAGFGK